MLTRDEAFKKAKDYFRYANLHSSSTTWRKEYKANKGFYDGSGQWLERDLEKLRARRQAPITVNVIQSRIDNVSGTEIQSRFRIACRNDSSNQKADLLANALTHYLYYIQRSENIANKSSEQFRDMLIGGIGWSNIYKENGVIHYEHVEPFNILPDPDDLSPQYTSSRFICRKRWMDVEIAKNTWPSKLKDIDLADSMSYAYLNSIEMIERGQNALDTDDYIGYKDGKIPVIEVQFKVFSKYYSGIDYQGNYFETFDADLGQQLTGNSGELKVKEGQRIMRILFVGETLLEFAPLMPDVPNCQDFGYIPCVWKRRFKDGVPYGLVEGMKGLQVDLNTRLAKALHLANSSLLFVKGGNIGSETTIAEKLKQGDAVIHLNEAVDFKYEANAPLTEVHVKLIDKYDQLMQRVTGIFDEAMGMQTNAISGVAQKQRQINSVRNNVFGFDNFANTKKREGRFMLHLIQSSWDENLEVQILNEDEKQSVVLNCVKEVNGSMVFLNDIRTLPLSTDVEEVPDYNSSFEENKAAIEGLLSNPNAMFIMQTPTLMTRLGIRDADKIAQEMQEAVMRQNQASMVVNQAAQQPSITTESMLAGAM